MQIVKTYRYLQELEKILEFIAQDSYKRALKFKNDIDKQVIKIIDFPYKHRQSLKIEDTNIRELIFKGYTIPYKIEANSNIIILGIFNQNDWDI